MGHQRCSSVLPIALQSYNHIFIKHFGSILTATSVLFILCLPLETINTSIFSVKVCLWTCLTSFNQFVARRGGVADWTVERTIRVQFLAYIHRVWALWWQGGKRRLRSPRYPCRGRLGTPKTPSCPWRWMPGSNSKFSNWTTVPSLYSWNIAECDVKPQPTGQPICHQVCLKL